MDLQQLKPGQKRPTKPVFLEEAETATETATEFLPLRASSQVASWCGTEAAQMLSRRTYTALYVVGLVLPHQEDVCSEEESQEHNFRHFTLRSPSV